MLAIELVVFLDRAERRRLAELGELRNVLAPRQRRRKPEQRRVADERREQLLHDKPDVVGLLAPHRVLLLLIVVANRKS
jgi:CelD/BcsL family acetyltransferase involved in cellulose biosynthesis